MELAIGLSAPGPLAWGGGTVCRHLFPYGFPRGRSALQLLGGGFSEGSLD